MAPSNLGSRGEPTSSLCELAANSVGYPLNCGFFPPFFSHKRKGWGLGRIGPAALALPKEIGFRGWRAPNEAQFSQVWLCQTCYLTMVYCGLKAPKRAQGASAPQKNDWRQALFRQVKLHLLGHGVGGFFRGFFAGEVGGGFCQKNIHNIRVYGLRVCKPLGHGLKLG